MEHRQVAVCILGGGPAALIAGILLHRQGVDACVVAASDLGSLRAIKVAEDRIGPMPVFANADSELFRRMRWAPLQADDYVRTGFTVVSADSIEKEVQQGSYAEFLLHRFVDAPRRLMITQKQFGAIAFEDELPELRRKVVSHYGEDTSTPRRVGFVDGVSPYLAFIEAETAGERIPENARSIDLGGRCVFTDSHSIGYKTLLSTVPLLDSLALAGVKTPLVTYGAGAQMLVVSASCALSPNQVLYDCRVSSLIHRIFVPRSGYVILQIACSGWEMPTTVIVRQLVEMLGLDREPSVIKRFKIFDCYPLGVNEYSLRDSILADLQAQHVVQFGRFAEWKYLDLHELDWDRVTCLG